MCSTISVERIKLSLIIIIIIIIIIVIIIVIIIIIIIIFHIYKAHFLYRIIKCALQHFVGDFARLLI